MAGGLNERTRSVVNKKQALVEILEQFPSDEELAVSRRRFIAAGVGATAAGLGLAGAASAAPASGNRPTRGLSQTPPADAAPPEQQVINFPADVNTAKVLDFYEQV